MADIIVDTPDLKRLAPSFHKQNANSNMSPYISDAAQQYLTDYISQELYDQLATEQAGNSVTTANQKIIGFLRTSLAYFTIYETLPYINVTISSAGAMTNQAQNGQFTGVRQWEKKASSQNAINKADMFLDKALEIMYSNPDDYPLWRDSSAYTANTNHLINDAKAFTAHALPISRRTFLALSPWLTTAEHKYIRAATGTALLAGLKTRIAADTLTSNDHKILPLIRRSLAFYTLLMGAPTLQLDIGAAGIRLVSQNDGITSMIPASEDYKNWRRELEGYAKEALGECKNYLEDNYEDFPRYESSTAKGNDTPRSKIRDNSKSKSSFMT